MNLSATFGYVRARQLEGTFPGDPLQGTWLVSNHRITRGWGVVPEEEWACDSKRDAWPPKEPPEIDAKAKPYRVHDYQRVRSADDCRRALSMRLPVSAGFEITEQWHDPPDGVIEMPTHGTPIAGSHCVLLVASSPDGFSFVNSWGREWGNEGFGKLSAEFFDAYVIESWVAKGVGAFLEDLTSEGIQEIAWGTRDYLGGVLHGREIHDGTSDVRIAWAFAVCRDGFLDVEELFVMPDYRGKGYGARLANMLRQLSQELGMNLRMWVPFADCEPDNLPGVQRIAAKLGLELETSGVRWAGLKAVAHAGLSKVYLPPRPIACTRPPEEILAMVSMPERPAYLPPGKRALGSLAVAAALAAGISEAHQPEATGETPAARSSDSAAGTVSDDEFAKYSAKALEKFAPVYERLASSEETAVPRQPSPTIPADQFDAAAAKAFEKYAELYDRLS